jgi:hypothetical protein
MITLITLNMIILLSLLFPVLTNSLAAGEMTAPTVNDKNLSITVLAKNIANASEFLPIGKDVFIIYNSTDKVSLVGELGLKKYPVLDVNPGNSGQIGLAGLSLGNLTNGSDILLGYVVPTDAEANLYNLTKIVYSYVWNRTALKLDNPERVVEVPLSNKSRYDTGTIVIDRNGSKYLAVDTSSSQPSDKSKADLYRKGNCVSGLLRIPIENSVNLSHTSETIKNTSIVTCFNGRLHGLSYQESANHLWGILSFSTGLKRITAFSIDKNNTNIYRICGDNLVGMGPNSNGSTFKDNFCSNKNDTTPLLNSLAYVDSLSLRDSYLNHLLLGYSNGSIYDVKVDPTVWNSTNKLHLFSSGAGYISEIEEGDNGLYVLATPAGSLEPSLYLIGPVISTIERAELVISYENLSLIATAIIASTIIGALLLHKRHNLHQK